MATKQHSKPPVRTCRVCHCTYAQGCGAGCAWVDGEDLCTTCYVMLDALADWYMEAHLPSFRRLRHELERLIGNAAAILGQPLGRQHARP